MDKVQENQKIITQKNPPGYNVDMDTLIAFEDGLDYIHPEDFTVPPKVLGFGEISTVFEIQVDGFRGWAFKRLSIFETVKELESYLQVYEEYNRLLEEEIGIALPTHGFAAVFSPSDRPIFYIIQKKLDKDSIGSNVVKNTSLDETYNQDFFLVVLGETWKVWAYSHKHPKGKVGLDAQISNWNIVDFDSEVISFPVGADLSYLDTSTPFFLVDGKEQLDPELFLRPAPSFLTWILRWLFLEDVVTRYYSFRKVTVDIIANYYKEGRSDLVPLLVDTANEYFIENDLDYEAITIKEVDAYYKEDAMIWRLYANMRRVDRTLHRIFGKEYPYLLPGKVKR